MELSILGCIRADHTTGALARTIGEVSKTAEGVPLGLYDTFRSSRIRGLITASIK